MKRKTFALLLVTLTTSFLACKEGGDDPAPGGVTERGTYVGNIQVADDPQTKLGYIYNAKVKVTTNGNNVTFKITGNDGFDREYVGTLFSPQTPDSFTITEQIKPTKKGAAGTATFLGGEFGIQIGVNNEIVIARENPTATQTIQISGKLSMIGTRMLKE